MTRRLFNATSALSLLVFVCLAVVCVRSQFRSDFITCSNSTNGDGSASQWTTASIAARRPWWAANLPVWYDERQIFTDRGGIAYVHDRVVAANLGGLLPLTGWEHEVEDADQRSIPLLPAYESSGTFGPPSNLSKIGGFNGSAKLQLPHWLLLCVFGTLPSIAVGRRVRSRHQPIGTCGKCGYDLRASKDYCPECGTPIPEKATATCL